MLMNWRAFFWAAVLSSGVFASANAENIDIPEENSIRILQSGKVLASWPVDGAGAINFSRLFYVVAGGQIYLCRVEERNRNIDAKCFARSGARD